MRKSWSSILLAALIAQIPFELRYEVLGLSNLQWTFVVLVVVTAPLLIENWKWIIRQRAVQAAGVFVFIQWLIALSAPEFQTNAAKAAVRYTAGALLFVIAAVKQSSPPQLRRGEPRRSSGWGGVGQGNESLDQHHPGASRHPSSVEEGSSLRVTWVTAATIAAAYALLAYAGLGMPWLFRTEEFYIGQVQRLSGSFEYPNTAAAYFAMSLPIVWWSPVRSWLRWIIAFLLWCAVILTFSRGALLAVPVAITMFFVFGSSSAMKWRSAAALLLVGVASYIILMPINPYWIERLYGPDVHSPLSAEYKTAWNHLRQQPGSADQIPIQVRNVGSETWRVRGLGRIAIGYRWWHIASETFVPSSRITTNLPHDTGRSETVDAVVHFQTPAEPGRYLLVIELFRRDYDWLSRIGVIPALVEVDVQPGVARTADDVDMSAFYHRRPMPNVFTVSVARADLWKAALKMILEHPFGVGPDNYRLEYGRYIGAARWDTHVYSNNLGLEILTGSGVLGFAAFIWLLIAIPWRFDADSISIGIFLFHGMVDVFLMTTPIYFAFWLLLGSHADGQTIG
jgi:hypothetical protein